MGKRQAIHHRINHMALYERHTQPIREAYRQEPQKQPMAKLHVIKDLRSDPLDKRKKVCYTVCSLVDLVVCSLGGVAPPFAL